MLILEKMNNHGILHESLALNYIQVDRDRIY